MYGTGILLFAESDKAAWSHKEMRRILPHRYEFKACSMRGGNSEACWASSIAAGLFEHRSASFPSCNRGPAHWGLIFRTARSQSASRQSRAPGAASAAISNSPRFAYAPPRKPLVNHIFKDFANESCF